MFNPKVHGAVARRVRLKREFPRLNWQEINRLYEEASNVDSNRS